jgi:tetratricopeptide (TPR) repeat protein
MDKTSHRRRKIALLFAFIASLQVLVFSFSDLKAEENPHHPDQTLSQKDRALLALARKEYENAIPDFVQLVQEESADSYLLRGFVKAFKGVGRLDEADQILLHLEKKYPTSSEVKFGLGLSALYQGKNEIAESLFGESIKINSQNALAWNAWSTLLAEKGSYDSAVQKNWEAIRINPEEPIFFENLRFIYNQMKHPDLFVDKYSEQVEKGESKVALGFAKILTRELRQEGFRYYSQNKIDLAIESFLKMEKIYNEVHYISGIVPALFSLGLLYEEKGDIKTSQLYFQRVLSLNPQHLQARDKIK